ncbi:MAG: TIGR00725 family protein [Colwellia sp.]
MAIKQFAVIGSARLMDEKVIAISREVGQIVARMDANLVCGGLGGVMLESCRGFKSIESEGRAVGVLPSYDASSANEYIDIVIPTGLDVGRNQIVVASASAVIVIGGGAGTLSEIALASQINKPILLIKNTGGWADKLTDDYLDNRKNSRMHHVDDIRQLPSLLVDIVTKHHISPGAINSGHNNESNRPR